MQKILLLLIFFFLTRFLYPHNIQTVFSQTGEYQLIEITQIIVLLFCLGIHLLSKRFFLAISNLFTFLIKTLFFLFIIYEELSFLSFDSNNLFNYQQELNFHNSYFIKSNLISFGIPGTNFSYDLTLEIFASCSTTPVEFQMSRYGYVHAWDEAPIRKESH